MRTLVRYVAAVAGGVAVVMGLGAVQQGAPRDKAQTKGLVQRLHELEASVQRMQMFDPPVGTVMAFAGEWPPDGLAREAWEKECGWMLCDGRELESKEYQQLASALRAADPASGEAKPFHLPNLQGMFLRGTPQSGRRVGSPQGWATAMPHKPFTTSNAGQHDHSVTKGGVTYNLLLTKNGKQTTGALDDAGDEPNLVLHAPMVQAGRHNHTVNGGDDETRPVNVAVHWIIKFRSGR